MRPMLLKGHARPLTAVQFNSDGDLLFTSAKDASVCLWRTSNGERVGTYDGHNGAIWAIDVNEATTRLLTGSSDRFAKLWDVQTGTELLSIRHSAVVRTVGIATGDRMVVTGTDSSFSTTPTISIFNLPSEDDMANKNKAGDADDNDNDSDSKGDDIKPIRTIEEKSIGKFSSCLWGDLNQTIIAGCDDGTVRVYDVETGKETTKIQVHKKAVSRMNLSWDRTMFITSGLDHTACLFDTRSLQHLKTYESNRPLNAACIDPLGKNVILGGGQDAMDVTTTDARVGHFEADFHSLIYENKLGSVKGHFGPIHCVAMTPDGSMYVSGSEDGYARLHKFDKSYFGK